MRHVFKLNTLQVKPTKTINTVVTVELLVPSITDTPSSFDYEQLNGFDEDQTVSIPKDATSTKIVLV